jgi:hypothetical protein
MLSSKIRTGLVAISLSVAALGPMAPLASAKPKTKGSNAARCADLKRSFEGYRNLFEASLENDEADADIFAEAELEIRQIAREAGCSWAAQEGSRKPTEVLPTPPPIKGEGSPTPSKPSEVVSTPPTIGGLG